MCVDRLALALACRQGNGKRLVGKCAGDLSNPGIVSDPLICAFLFSNHPVPMQVAKKGSI
jgi:hypothetical protein